MEPRDLGRTGLEITPIGLGCWQFSQGIEAVVAIPGASRPERAAEAAAAMDVQLSAAEIDRIDRLSAAVARM